MLGENEKLPELGAVEADRAETVAAGCSSKDLDAGLGVEAQNP